MSTENDQAAVESARAANELREAFRNSSIADVRAAYARATRQPARWMDRSYKTTTLAAVFVTDCTAAIVLGYPDDRRRLLAELVLNDADTLRAVHLLGGALHRIEELLRPLSDLSSEELARRIAAACGR